MKFVDIGGKNVAIRICAQFEYRGYTISTSTIMTEYTSVAVINSNDIIVKSDIDSVENAIEYVNNIKNMVCVDKGAIKMAANVLRRAGKDEVADELVGSVYE